ncbi:MAG: dihydroorotate dehydrogenase-like protein [Acidimicrobiia bacterium]|nr:dihydroorotate dehydrogenase-like protein [Acidimicrobiia bacterium]
MTADLSTSYLGMTFANPIVASSSPMTESMDALLALQESGIGGVVLPSLWEEQIEHEAMEMQRLYEVTADSFAESLSGYFPEYQDYATRTESYLAHLVEAKQALEIPVIASLNGTTRGGWTHYAKKIEEAGADALELNVYLIPTDPYASGRDVEKRYLDLVSAVRAEVSIPLAVKIGPYFSSLPNMARELVDAGADGLVLFNRFFQPDIDLESLEVVPRVSLSPRSALLLPLRWTGILCGQVQASFGITSGVHTAEDALKAILVGADVAMMASALLRGGADVVSTMLGEIQQWLDEHEYDSIEQMKGSMAIGSSANPDAFVRANYMKILTTYTSQVS